MSVETAKEEAKVATATKEAKHGNEPPHESSEPPHESSEPPHESSEPPHESLEPPHESLEPPHASSEPPHASSEPPHASSEPPHDSSEPPHDSSEPPRDSSDPLPNGPIREGALEEGAKADEDAGAEEQEEQEEPVVVGLEEKPQLSDPEEPDDDVPIVLVTEAPGYVSTHLIKLLLEQGRFRVRGTVGSLEEEQVRPLRELVTEPKYSLRLIEADLQNAKSWIEAVRRCRYVFSVASSSPPLKTPRNADLLIKPAVEGTTNVLKACADSGSGSVRRVVLTSSIAAVSSGVHGNPDAPQDHIYTEKDWSAETTCPAYERGVLKAEQAAWEFVKQLEEDRQFELVTLCPGTIMGPLLIASDDTSANLCCDILTGKTSGYPDISTTFIDVRDVAEAHIAALEKPQAAGNRYLLVHNETIPFKQIGQVLAAEFNPQGYKIATKDMSRTKVKIAKLFSASAKQAYPLIGKHLSWSNEKMRNDLGIEPRDIQETVIDMGYSVIKLGLVPKKKGYLGHPSTRPPPEEGSDETDYEGEAETAITSGEAAVGKGQPEEAGEVEEVEGVGEGGSMPEELEGPEEQVEPPEETKPEA